MVKTNKTYLKRASLDGFKTIKNVDVNFNEGLNIVIGKNAIGKTNLLYFLYNLLNFQYEVSFRFSANLEFSGTNDFNILTEGGIDIKRRDIENKKEPFSNSFQGKFKLENISKEFDKGNIDIIKTILLKKDSYFTAVYLKHGIPNHYDIVDKPLSFSVDKEGITSYNMFELYQNSETPRFLKYFILKIILATIEFKKGIEEENIGEYNEIFKNSFLDLNEFRETLGKFSPIKDVRLSNNYSINKGIDNYLLNNIYFEFYVDEQWLPFSSLSDGTKRVFYIISELYSFKSENEFQNLIFLIEEPELGIHPHQFYELLSYINDCSKRSQIILTTHSPQSLNILNESELDKIILGTNVNNHSIFKHLDDDKKDKAIKYMSEDYLSDYWLYSDLD